MLVTPISLYYVRHIFPGVALVLLLAVLVAGTPAAARSAKKKVAPAPAPAPKTEPRPPAPNVSSICIEAESGGILFESNADQPRPPASMIKMMMFLLVSEGIRDGKWTLDTDITITKHAEGMGGTQVYVKEGDVWKLGDLMRAIAVASANDGAMAVAEGLWGSEDAYKKRMNERAAELGMSNSKFSSVHGLPPEKGGAPDNTTARDMARLAQVCVKDTLILSWTSLKEASFRSEKNVETSTNKLLTQLNGCDGLKTGFTRSAGFCVTATVKRNDMRLIAVVMGFQGNQARFDAAKQLIEDGFAHARRVQVLHKGERVGQPVLIANCETPRVQLVAAEDLWTVVKESDQPNIRVVTENPDVIRAPVAAGDILGKAHAQLADRPLSSVALAAPGALPEAGWRWKLVQGIRPTVPAIK